MRSRLSPGAGFVLSRVDQLDAAFNQRAAVRSRDDGRR
jgi:hypothetical protein